MRKFLLSLLCGTLIINLCFGFFVKVEAFADAEAEIAMELTSGKVLTESNADAVLPMASTTKILTAIIIIEDCNLDDVIRVPDEAVGVEGSSIYLKKGEEIDVRDLLYGLMLRSGNDSAAALAIHHSGSIEKFAQTMNERAKKIGAINSHFKNPSGLPDTDHYTTARDLCKIACYAMNNAVFREIVATTEYTGKYRSYTNKNKILRLYEGANGVKTGYTLKAGRCLVSSAKREGMDVVCVVLNCPEMYERSCEIFDDCFNCYSLITIDCHKEFMCNRILCKLKNSYSFVVNNGAELDYRVIPLKNLKKSKKECYVADLEIYDQNELIFSEKLYSI